jgi:hypothetical protein
VSRRKEDRVAPIALGARPGRARRSRIPPPPLQGTGRSVGGGAIGRGARVGRRGCGDARGPAAPGVGAGRVAAPRRRCPAARVRRRSRRPRGGASPCALCPGAPTALGSGSDWRRLRRSHGPSPSAWQAGPIDVALDLPPMGVTDLVMDPSWRERVANPHVCVEFWHGDPPGTGPARPLLSVGRESWRHLVHGIAPGRYRVRGAVVGHEDDLPGLVVLDRTLQGHLVVLDESSRFRPAERRPYAAGADRRIDRYLRGDAGGRTKVTCPCPEGGAPCT